MPSVMIRKDASGQMTFYVPKKDLEEKIVSIQHDTPDLWGGEVTLADGSKYFLEPMTTPPHLPITLRAKRAGED
jgi:nitrogen fixation protein NifT